MKLHFKTFISYGPNEVLRDTYLPNKLLEFHKLIRRLNSLLVFRKLWSFPSHFLVQSQLWQFALVGYLSRLNASSPSITYHLSRLEKIQQHAHISLWCKSMQYHVIKMLMHPSMLAKWQKLLFVAHYDSFIMLIINSYYSISFMVKIT